VREYSCARRAPDATVWSAPQPIYTSASVSGGNVAPAIGADVAGNITYLFNQSNTVLALHYRAGAGQWESAIDIGVPANGSGVAANSPVLAADRTGSISAVWFAWTSLNGVWQYPVMWNRFQ